MSFRDGTGPLGEGPKTGRGLGSCNSKKKPMFDERPRWGLRRNLQKEENMARGTKDGGGGGKGRPGGGRRNKNTGPCKKGGSGGGRGGGKGGGRGRK